MLDSGQIIADRYELLKQLGRGGFSEVWLAQDKLTDVKVAIKIYAPGMGLDPEISGSGNDNNVYPIARNITFGASVSF